MKLLYFFFLLLQLSEQEGCLFINCDCSAHTIKCYPRSKKYSVYELKRNFSIVEYTQTMLEVHLSHMVFLKNGIFKNLTLKEIMFSGESTLILSAKAFVGISHVGKLKFDQVEDIKVQVENEPGDLKYFKHLEGKINEVVFISSLKHKAAFFKILQELAASLPKLTIVDSIDFIPDIRFMKNLIELRIEGSLETIDVYRVEQNMNKALVTGYPRLPLSLEKLHLTKTRFKYFNSSLLVGLRNLTVLDLSENFHFQVLSRYAFDQPYSAGLNLLDLTDSSIKIGIEDEAFCSWRKKAHVEVNNLRISHYFGRSKVDVCMFSFVKNLTLKSETKCECTFLKTNHTCYYNPHVTILTTKYCPEDKFRCPPTNTCANPSEHNTGPSFHLQQAFALASFVWDTIEHKPEVALNEEIVAIYIPDPNATTTTRATKTKTTTMRTTSLFDDESITTKFDETLITDDENGSYSRGFTQYIFPDLPESDETVSEDHL